MYIPHIIIFSYCKQSQAQKKSRVFSFNKAHHVHKKSKTSIATFFYKKKRSCGGSFRNWYTARHAFVTSIDFFKSNFFAETFAVFIRVTVCPYSLMVRT